MRRTKSEGEERGGEACASAALVCHIRTVIIYSEWRLPALRCLNRESSWRRLFTLSDWVASWNIRASMAAATRLFAAVMAWMSPVRWRLNYQTNRIVWVHIICFFTALQDCHIAIYSYGWDLFLKMENVPPPWEWPESSPLRLHLLRKNRCITKPF